MAGRTSGQSEVVAFLRERREWLHVRAVPSVRGGGYDVALVLDGSYTIRSDAEDMARFMAGILAEAMRADGLPAVAGADK